jgi:DNA polymerase-3 subunit gamma/tau
MPYVSLYRKYRSQTFEDVMGQDHVTRTLQNAIRQGKVAHAYLFCGTRGTGKTTTARLLAKAMNCEQGPTPEPCNECASCTSITQGAAMDIMELDAASHRSIEDIKDIRENIKFPPMELRYKVFIIDEAHQLSKDAKDAFLKTLEEPPGHAIFILATTEPQSIPVTIRSRCQQFDFRRGSLKDIRDRLKFVAESEGVKVDEAALDLIASNAEGSWRDSLSLLEQVLAYTDGAISEDDVNTVIGAVNQDFLFSLADTLAAGDEHGAFEAAAEAVESGKEVQQLLKSIARHFRNLLFASVSSNPQDLDVGEDSAARLKEQAAKFTRQLLLRIIETFSQTERDARYTDQHRLLLELALLKAIEAARPVERAAVEQRKPIAAPERKPAPEMPRVEREPPPRAAPPASALKAEQPVEAPRPAASQQALPEFDTIRDKWEQVLQHIKSVDRPTHSLLETVAPVGMRGGSLVLRFKYEAHANLIDKDKSDKNTKRKTLLSAIERVFGVPNVGLICEVGLGEEPGPEAPAPPVNKSEDEDLPNPFDESSLDPGEETLKNVMDLYPDARIVAGE